MANSTSTRRQDHRGRLALVGCLTLAWAAAIGGARAALLPGAPVTWIVDDDGGPGVNFTDLQPAIDAAVDGDLILVHPGSYGDFVLTENLTIVGEAGAHAQRGSIQGVSDRASLAALEFRDLDVLDCSGTVVLDELLAYDTQSYSTSAHPVLTVRNCADVRVIETDSAPSGSGSGGYVYGRRPQVVVDNSRVELVSSMLLGARGKDATQNNPYGGDGGNGVEVLGGGRVHLARSSSTGGDGGDHWILGQNGYGGDGGDGLRVSDGEAIAAGRGAELFSGGHKGNIVLYGYAGNPGDGIRVDGNGNLRYSNVISTSTTGVGVKVTPTPPDPTLERVASTGNSLTMKLRSDPGAFSRLFIGLDPRVQPTPGVVIESLLVKQTTVSLGKVPVSGILKFSIPLDPGWTEGTTVYFQAMSIFPGGEIRRTNSVPLVVR